MPRFRNVLRRIPTVEPAKSEHKAIEDSVPPVSQAHEINLNASDFDLASIKLDPVNVGCWLDLRRLKWGIYKERQTAVMHLTIEADHQPEVEVRWFEVGLVFAVPPSEQVCKVNGPEIEVEISSPPDSCGVHLVGRPAPHNVHDISDSQGSRWNFGGHRFAPTGGLATSAQWRWSATTSDASLSE